MRLVPLFLRIYWTCAVVIGQQQRFYYKYDSYCHEPNTSWTIAKQTSLDDATKSEWCILALNPTDGEPPYATQVYSPTGDETRPQKFNWTKLRALCHRFNANMINIDPTENVDDEKPTQNTMVRRLIAKVDAEERASKNRSIFYPIDCASRFDVGKVTHMYSEIVTELIVVVHSILVPPMFYSKSVPACERGPVPENYEIFFLYSHLEQKFASLNRTAGFENGVIAKHTYFICQQKVNVIKYGQASRVQSPMKYTWPILTFVILLID